MTKEEIKAMNECKVLMICLYDYMSIKKSRFYCNQYKIILELIEKQQKEIEELKERNQTCIKESDLMNAVSFLMNRNDMSNYISKDKIKEKIEEITSYAYTSAEERDCQDYAIQVLKELLGE